MEDEEHDRSANSHASKRVRPSGKPEPVDIKDVPGVKKIEPVVAEGDVIIPKKGLGRKFREVFAGADAKGAMRYVMVEVLGPTFRNLIIDATTKGVERLMYPDANPPGRRMYGPQMGRTSSVSYGSSVGYRPAATRPPVGVGRPIDVRVTHPMMDEYVLVHRGDALKVVERMADLLETYNVVTVADLHELLRRPISHTENKFGWDTLRGVDVVPHKDGWVITLGPPGELNF